MSKTALLFPGQGSQYVGMGKSLYDSFEVARQRFEEASEILGFDLKRLCFEGSLEDLTQTGNTQPAILTASIAAYEVYKKEIGIKPDYACGHSLGEISALVCSGAVAFGDAVKIVRQRGLLMQDAASAGTGAMAAVTGLDRDTIELECKKVSGEDYLVVISNYNSPEQTVVSGHKKAVECVCTILTGLGARIVPLKVSAPFHSPIMKSAAERLIQELMKYKYNPLKVPVISNVNALPYAGETKIVETLTTQITSPVKWVESMNYLVQKGVTQAVELGPQTVLKNLMKKNAPVIITYAFDNEEDFKAIKNANVSKDLNMAGGGKFVPTVVTKCIAIAVCTRNRNWDNEEYQKGVIDPYRRIQQMQEEIEKEGRQPTLSEMKQALDMLMSVFITKRTPVEEQIERFNEVFDTTATRELFSDFELPKVNYV